MKNIVNRNTARQQFGVHDAIEKCYHGLDNELRRGGLPVKIGCAVGVLRDLPTILILARIEYKCYTEVTGKSKVVNDGGPS